MPGKRPASSDGPVEFHPIAAMFPLLEGDELQRLAEDIYLHGQRLPAWTYEGKVLDGRNRAASCLMAGVGLKTCEFQGDRGEAVAFAWSMNGPRRHLTPDQLAAIAVAMLPELEKAAKERQKANAPRKGEKGFRPMVNPKPGEPIDKHPNQSTAQAAAVVGVKRYRVEAAKAIAEKAPDQLEEIREGRKTIAEVQREVQRQEKRDRLEARAAALPPAAAATATILEGDCLAILPTLVDPPRLIFADPPYNLGVDYGDGGDGDSLSSGNYVEWCTQWVMECARLLAPDGSLWVMICDEWADHLGLIMRLAGLHRRAWIKWYETFGVNRANNFNHTSRHIFYCVKDPSRFVFNRDAVCRPSDRQTKYGDKRANPEGKVWDDVWEIPRLTGTCAEREPDVPTQLPLTILRAIVGCASEPADMVLDPFCGSGTTGVAAVELGRRFVGIEKEETFCQIARRRIAGTTSANSAGPNGSRGENGLAALAARVCRGPKSG